MKFGDGVFLLDRGKKKIGEGGAISVKTGRERGTSLN